MWISTRSVRLTPEPLEDRLAPAAAGDLDPSFGTGGITTVSFQPVGRTAVQATAMAFQPDGRMVIAGTVQTGAGGNTDFGLVRLNPDGTVDPSFGADGRVTLGFDLGGSNSDTAAGVAVLADGRIVVAGTVARDATGNTDIGIVRLNPDGSVDPSFGSSGRTVVGFDLGGANTDTAVGVALAPGDTIVVAATAMRAGGDSDFAVFRLTAGGVLDPAFNGSGTIVVPFNLGGTNAEEAAAIAVRPDGRVVVAGTVARDAPEDTDFAVAQLTTAGALDPAFGTAGNGRAVVSFDQGGANRDRAAALALAPDGRVVIAGRAEKPVTGDFDFAVARLTASGGTDKTFGTGGRAVVGFDLAGNTADQATGVAVLADGRVVVAGTASTGGNGARLAVLRLSVEGTADPVFGLSGKVTVAVTGGRDEGAALLVQADNRIVVAGTAGVGSADPPFAAIRLLGAPSGDLIVSGRADGTASLYAPSSRGGDYHVVAVESPFAGFTGVVRGAAGDVTGDGVPDRVFGTGPGAGPRLKVVDGVTGATLADFFAFEPTFLGGLFVVSADLDGDGLAEVVVTPDQGGGPVVAIYSGARLSAGLTGEAAQIVRFFGIADPAFRGGARAAVGDLNGDGTSDVVVAAGFLGGPRVAVFDGRSVSRGDLDPARLVADFFVFEPTVRNGAFVAAGDLDGDGAADLVVGGGPTAGPRVRIASGRAVATSGGSALDAALADFFAGDPASRGGGRVAVKDKALVVGSGEGEPSRVQVYPGASLGAAPGPQLGQQFDPFGGVVAAGVFVG